MPSQQPSALFMIRPARPRFNSETSKSNAFQSDLGDIDQATLTDMIRSEFDNMVYLLRSHDIEVNVFEDATDPVKPDSHFPNNWISTHPDETVIVYPMNARSRRLERRQDVVDWLAQHYSVRNIVDISDKEKEGKFLEGTGSLVFDYVNSVVYACLSERTNEALVNEVANRLSCRALIFDAVDERGRPIYHTNVAMSIGAKYATLCLDSINDEQQQELLLTTLMDTGHKVVSISFDQMRAFAGNMIEVQTKSGEPVVALSETAFNSLLPGQVHAISQYADMLPIPIPTIEKIGGGSVRCMIAGIYLPKPTIE